MPLPLPVRCRFSVLPLLAVFCAAPAASGQDQAQLLRLRWEVGSTYTQETTTESTTMLTALGMPEDQKMQIRQKTLIEVKPVEGGEKAARVTFAAIAGEMQIQGQKHVFDSENMAAAHPMIRQSLGASVGQSFVLRYSADDEFLGVEDTGSMVDAPDGSPGLIDIARAKEVAELFRRSLEMGLPKTPVRAGDRWTSKETVNFPKAGVMQVELRAKFDTVVTYNGRRHVKISFEGDMNRADDRGGAADPALRIGTGSKTSGQVLYDLERQTVSFAAFHANLILEVEGKRIPVRQQVTTKVVKLRS